MQAYDAVIYIHERTVSTVADELSKHLQIVSAWFLNAVLSLNIKKAMSVCFASKIKSTRRTKFADKWSSLRDQISGHCT